MTTDTPLVTISIPTYNQERYIARAIESALAQTYRPLEIIVSDDRSSDRTLEIARNYEGGPVRVFTSEQNVGRVANYRRCLIDFARGGWMVNLDGDDYYNDPDFVARALSKIGSEPGIVMYAAGATELNERTGTLHPQPLGLDVQERCMSGVDYVLGYPRLNAFQHFAVLYDRALALQTDFYSLDSLGTDTDSLCRLALKGKVYVERRHVGVWTHHDRNASYSLTEAEAAKEIRMLEHIAEALAGHVPEAVARDWLRRRIAEKRRFVTVLTLSKARPREGWTYFFKHAEPNLFYAREFVKLALRSLGLK
jgi:glycosyltransferase involved in cell wall biosynthesis